MHARGAGGGRSGHAFIDPGTPLGGYQGTLLGIPWGVPRGPRGGGEVMTCHDFFGVFHVVSVRVLELTAFTTPQWVTSRAFRRLPVLLGVPRGGSPGLLGPSGFSCEYPGDSWERLEWEGRFFG